MREYHIITAYKHTGGGVYISYESVNARTPESAERKSRRYHESHSDEVLAMDVSEIGETRFFLDINELRSSPVSI